MRLLKMPAMLLEFDIATHIAVVAYVTSNDAKIIVKK